MAAVPVVLFADFTCPFSYVTEAALRRLESEGTAAVETRAFELHPPGTWLPPGGSAADVEAARPLAEELGLPLAPPPLAARTRKAHEAARFAASRGVGREMREALYAAYFRDGRDVGRIDVLVELGAALGLDESELKVVLDVDAFAGEIAADRALAARLGIAGTPAMLAGTGGAARLVVGAYPLADLRRELAEVAAQELSS